MKCSVPGNASPTLVRECLNQAIQEVIGDFASKHWHLNVTQGEADQLFEKITDPNRNVLGNLYLTRLYPRIASCVRTKLPHLSAFGSCCEVQATSEGLLSKIMEITMPFSSSVRYCGYGAGINLSTCPRATLFNPPLIKSTKITSLLPLYALISKKDVQHKALSEDVGKVWC